MKDKKILLLVEDEAITGMAEKMALEKCCYDVIHVLNGEKAIETIIEKKTAIDLILMDIDLGRGIDGTEAAEMILSQKDIPIVFLSSHTEPEIVEKTENITSYGYVVKNSGITVLDASIKMAFKLFDAKMKEKEKEEALWKSEKLYRAIFKGSLDGIVFIDYKGNFVDCNDSYLKMLGYTIEEIKIMNFYELTPEKWHKFEKDVIVPQLISKGYANTYEKEYIHKDGTVFPVELTAYQYSDKLLYGVARNITERKQMEETLKKSEIFFSQIFEQSTTSMCLYDPEGTIVKVNSEFCKMFGVEDKVILNGRFNVFKDQATIDTGIVPLLREIFDNKKTRNWETIYNIDVASKSAKIPTSRKGQIFLEVFGYPIVDKESQLKYVVLQYYNITRRKQAEKELEKNKILLHTFRS